MAINIEDALPIVKHNGLNTAQAASFSGTIIDTAGAVNIVTAEVTGGTGATASIGAIGSLAGGPATATQDGWLKVKIAGVQVYVPVWK